MTGNILQWYKKTGVSLQLSDYEYSRFEEGLFRDYTVERKFQHEFNGPNQESLSRTYVVRSLDKASLGIIHIHRSTTQENEKRNVSIDFLMSDYDASTLLDETITKTIRRTLAREVAAV